MAYNRTAELRELYFQQSRYSPTYIEESGKPYKPYGSLFQWPSNGYFDFRNDANLLNQLLQPYPAPGSNSVAEQVFGYQGRQQKLSLKHLANILYERALLHKSHLKEINRSLMHSHEKLSLLKMHFPVDAGRSQQNLERLVLQLQQQRRDEELAFWKDSSEIRQKVFEQASEYSATTHRKNMLYGLEG